MGRTPAKATSRLIASRRVVPRLARPLALGLLLALALAAGAAETPPASAAPAAPSPLQPVRLLFIGNSLTAANDLPLVVQAMAQAVGVPMEVRASAPPGLDLRDHWRRRAAKIVLASERWDYVILQQGPSTLPESRELLERWTGRWADAVRRREARPALYMVWPQRGQEDGFARVAASYRAAAQAHGAQLLAAGEAWQRALGASPGIELYSPDGLHPPAAGSYLAALVIARELAGVDPEAVPARLKLASGSELAVSEDVARVLRQASRQAVASPPAGGVAAPPR